MDRRRHGDRVFEALADSYRRRLLLTLFEESPQENGGIDPLDVPAWDEPSGDPDATRVRLYHVHLPKLGEMGYIEWDRESGGVSKGPRWAEVVPFVRLLSDHRDELPGELLPDLSSDD